MNNNCWCGGPVKTPSFGEYGPAVCLDSELHDPFATGRPERIDTLYVAGPMSGYPDCNYPAFNEAEERLSAAGYAVVNPTKVHIGDRKHHYVDLIREDLRMMLDARGVAVLDNWWESVGARNEVNVAGILKMPVRPLSEWLERAARELA